METLLFPLSEYWWLYGAFTGLVLLLLTLDLGVFHRTAHVVGFREATAWSVVWVGLALLFGYGFYLYALHTFPTNERLLAIPGFDPQAAARQAGLEYLLTGYIVEKLVQSNSSLRDHRQCLSKGTYEPDQPQGIGLRQGSLV